MKYNSSDLNDQYEDLQNNILLLYNKYRKEYTSYPIEFEDSDIIVDYLDQGSGLYNEATLVEIQDDLIIVTNRELEKSLEIDFTDLTTIDKLRILEIYEENIN